MERLFLMFLDHTQRRSTVGRTPLDELSARTQRPLPDNTRHSQQTNIHAPDGIRTLDLSRRAAAGRLPAEILSYIYIYIHIYIYDISSLRVNDTHNCYTTKIIYQTRSLVSTVQTLALGDRLKLTMSPCYAPGRLQNRPNKPFLWECVLIVDKMPVRTKRLEVEDLAN
jgi:hypothetical protein